MEEDNVISQSPVEIHKKMRRCPHCNSEIEIKNPWKALWRMPTLNEWIVLFMLIMILVISWAYKHDTAICREYVENIDIICMEKNTVATDNSANYSTNYSIKINKIINDTSITNSTNSTS